MRRMQWNRTSPRAAAAPATAQPWVVDTKYTVLLTAMIVALFFYMTISESVITGSHEEDLLHPNPIYRILKVSLLGLGILVVGLRHSLALVVVGQLNRFYIAFLGLVALSMTWSIEPVYTLTRLIALLTVSVAACAFVLVSWHPRRFQNVLRPLLTILLVASLVYCITTPDFAMEHVTGISLEGAWRGAFLSKNMFGQVASFAVILWAHAWFSKEVKIWPFLLGLGIGITCLMLSRSSTSWIATAFVVTLLWMSIRMSRPAANRKRRSTVIIMGVFVLVILIYSLAVLDLVKGLDFLFAPMTALTGKDLTFSGRTGIWELIREHIARRPLLGSGYGAYWIGPVPTSESYPLLKALYWYPTESHDGYLDMINDLGYVGLLCLLGYLWTYFRQAVALMDIDHTQAILYLALLFHQLITNLTETTWLSSSSLDFIVMTLATFAMARGLVEHRLRSQLTPTAPMRAPLRAVRSRALGSR